MGPNRETQPRWIEILWFFYLEDHVSTGNALTSYVESISLFPSDSSGGVDLQTVIFFRRSWAGAG